MIAIVDYNAGNIWSIAKALIHLGAEVEITKSAEVLEKADGVVLPGVGSFARMKDLERLREALVFATSEKPFLGICLGMQLLFEESEEADGRGLSVFEGKVARLRGNVKIPHIGWNSVRILKKSRIMEGIPDCSYFYFVHSYAPPFKEEITVGVTEHGGLFPSVIEKENVFAFQFHPEKSGQNGLRLLENFVKITKG
ncbi:MAG: imidazole glycerol phosphate synthase subunit HisH [Candidatus Micrarchaeia archaeon]